MKVKSIGDILNYPTNCILTFFSGISQISNEKKTIWQLYALIYFFAKQISNSVSIFNKLVDSPFLVLYN